MFNVLIFLAAVLTDHTDGEMALIPPHIVRYSLAQANHIDAQQTLNLITNPHLCSGQASQTNKVDHVIR